VAGRVETLAAAAICVVLTVYDQKLMGPRPLCLSLRWPDEVGIMDMRCCVKPCLPLSLIV
jgi:hypothetical protein